ncbi:MAG: quinon protein alcohol dehydrogenase-like superfamily [Monoraphidium minutum]|nr:MAG: quinon protein alcohol dehydrogenase-like superfamily [Monoraphidium minutum]
MPPRGSPAAFRLVAGDELGLLKVVEVPSGPKWDEASVVANWGAPDRKRGVSALVSAAAGLEPAAASIVAVGRLGGGVQVLDGGSGAQVAAWAAGSEAKGSSADALRVVGLHVLGSLPPTAEGQSAADAAAAARLRVLTVSGGGRVSVHSAAAGQEPWEASSFQAAPSVSCSAVSSGGGILAVGGEGCQLSLWDVAAQAKVWQAKGGKPNSIGLVDLAHVTAAAFVGGYPQRSGGGGGGGSEAAACPAGRHVVVVGNAAHKLLLYDTAAGRRPQLEVAWRDARITALAADDAGERVWAANGTGHAEALDLRAGRMSGALKGAAGSLRALTLHPGGEPLIASVGLDRFVRVHSTASRTNLGRAYTKQQLTAVAWLPPLAAAPAAEGAAGGDGGEEDGGADEQQQQQEKRHKQKDPQQQQQQQQQQERGKRKKQPLHESDPSDESGDDSSDDGDSDGGSSSDSADEEGSARQQHGRGGRSGGGSGGGGGRGGKRKQGGGGSGGGGRSAGRGQRGGRKRRK